MRRSEPYRSLAPPWRMRGNNALLSLGAIVFAALAGR